MKADYFKEHNVVFAKDQPEYTPLPALRIKDEKDTIIICWKLTFWERVRVLFLGRIWSSELNFFNPLTPRYLSTDKKDHFE